MIQLLIVRQSDHFKLIYDLVVANSVHPDLWDDIIYVVNILGLFYQEPQFKRVLINDNRLTQKLNVFLPKEEV